MPYFISILLIQLPLFALETAYGQLVRLKMHKAFSSINSRYRGFSYAQIVIGIYFSSYYVVLLAWSVDYFFYSF